MISLPASRKQRYLAKLQAAGNSVANKIQRSETTTISLDDSDVRWQKLVSRGGCDDLGKAWHRECQFGGLMCEICFSMCLQVLF